MTEPWDEDDLPGAGSVYQVGGVNWEWLSGWMEVVDSEQDTERDIVLTYEPQSSDTSVGLEIYYDHNSSPESWGFDLEGDGVKIDAGDTMAMFDINRSTPVPGHRVLRLKSHHDPYAYGDRNVQIRLSGVANNSAVRIYQVQLSGVQHDQSAGK